MPEQKKIRLPEENYVAVVGRLTQGPRFFKTRSGRETLRSGGPGAERAVSTNLESAAGSVPAVQAVNGSQELN